MSDEQLLQLVLLLQSATGSHPEQRNEALKMLDQAFTKVDAFNLIFRLLKTHQDQNVRLLAAIFIQNWVKKNYAFLENLQIQELLRVMTLECQIADPSHLVKRQLNVAIEQIGMLDFPTNTYLLERVPKDSEVSYKLLKGIIKKKLFLHREKLEFIFSQININIDAYFQAIQSQQQPDLFLQALKQIEIPLKMKILETRVLYSKKQPIKEYLHHLECLHQWRKVTDIETSTGIYSIIYLFQKFLIRTVNNQESKPTDDDLSYILQHILKFYIQDTSVIVNPTKNIKTIQDLKQVLNTPQNYQEYQERILRIILQVVRLISIALEKFTFSPLGINDMNDVYEYEVMEAAFYEGYFDEILKFLFSHAMQLSLIQTKYIFEEPEKSFSEEVEESVAYDVREASIDLLKSTFVSMKQDYITTLIETQVQNFQNYPIVNIKLVTINDQIAEVTYEIPPTDESQLWTCILQREAFYYMVSKLYRLIKNDIDLEQWFYSHLYGELMQQNPMFLPMRIQILSMLQSYFDSVESPPQDFCQIVSTACLQLIQQNEILSIKLGCVGCLTQCMKVITLTVPNIELIQQLFSQCNRDSSRVLLMDYFLQLLIVNAIDHHWFLNLVLNQWSSDRLSHRGKVLQIIAKTIQHIPPMTWFPALEMLLHLIHQSLSNDQPEVYLQENGLSLFLNLLSALSQEEQEQLAQAMASEPKIVQALSTILLQVDQIFINQTGLWNHCILAYAYTLVLGIPLSEQISQVALKAVLKTFDEVKEEAFARLLFVVELVILSNGPGIAIVEQIMEFLVGKIKIYHPAFQDHTVEQRELISITHILSVVSYTNPSYFQRFTIKGNEIIQQKEWFTPLVQKTFDAHKLQSPLIFPKLSLFYLMCSRLLRDDAYCLQQLQVSRSSGVPIQEMTLNCFAILEAHCIKRLTSVPSPIYQEFRQIFIHQEDDISLRGLLAPNNKAVNSYIFKYQTITDDFAQIRHLYPSQLEL